MRTLIVPDVHEQLDKLIHIEKTLFPAADRIIMLGDFFDTFNPVKHVIDICYWIHHHRDDPKLTLLWGNHDASYAFKGPWRCSGWTQKSQDIIDDILSQEDWRKFKVYAEVDGILISHGGFHPKTIHLADRDVEALAIEAALSGQWSPMWNVGYCRGGRAERGGPTWLDWNEEFAPMERPQIVGHTFDPSHRVRSKVWSLKGPRNDWDDKDDVTSWCIDTGLNHCAWVEDGVVSIAEVGRGV